MAPNSEFQAVSSSRAIVAVVHKQLEVAFTTLKKKEPYRDPQVNYEELVIKHNAPRWLRALEQYGYLAKHGELAPPKHRRFQGPLGPNARRVDRRR